MVKNRFILAPIAFAVLALVLYIGIVRAPGNHFLASVLIGKPVPQFSLPSLTSPGSTVSSKELLGKPYVINVWGTWCGECRVEHNALLQIQQLNKVPLIGINWRDEDSLALSWLAELGNPYTKVGSDKQGRLVIDLGVYGAPETFLIDAKGVIIHKHVGALSVEIFKRDFEPRLDGRMPPDAT